MTTDFDQFINKFQDETLKAVKQAQDTNVAALAQARELFAEMATFDKVPTLESLPTPSKFVEMSFDYAGKFFELRKQYALAVTDLFTAVQKDAAATVRG